MKIFYNNISGCIKVCLDKDKSKLKLKLKRGDNYRS